MNVNFNTSIINRNRTHLSSLISHLQIQVSFDHVAWLSGLSVIVKRIVVSNGVWHFDNLRGNHHQSHTPELPQKLSKMEKWSRCLGWKFRLSIESFQCIRKNHFMYIFGNICVIKPFKFWECHVKQKNNKEKVIISTRKCFVSLNPITPRSD